MSLEVNSLAPKPFFNPYIDWAMTLAQSRNKPEGDSLYRSYYLREKNGSLDQIIDNQGNLTADAVKQSLEAFLQSCLNNGSDAQDQAALIEPHEALIVATEHNARIANTSVNAQPIEFFAYIRASHVQDLITSSNGEFASSFDILEIGIPVPLNQMAATGAALQAQPSTTANGPIMAIVDDGIGFLNRTFVTDDGQSRFNAVWMQAIEKAPLGENSVQLGRTIEKPEIDDHLAQVMSGKAEDEIYRELHYQIAEAQSHQSLSFSTSHGTAVADLAFGKRNDLVDPLSLLAVQLPPEAVEDTSGVRFAPYLVMAVRWIIARAHLMDAGQQPLVITVSMGFLAGPKDGSHFVEYALSQTIKRWEEITGRKTHLVLPYGNDYESNQVARMAHKELWGHAPDMLKWVLQPDDQTACFMEIRSRPDLNGEQLPFDRTLPPNSSLILKAPDDGVIYEGLIPSQGTAINLNYKGSIRGRLYHAAPRQMQPDVIQPAMLLLALAPTADRIDGGLRSDAGCYSLDILDPTGSREFILQIQSGDTAPGYVSGSLQSYFDHGGAHDWNDRERDFTGLDDDGMIQYEGTNSALSTARLLPDTLGNHISSIASATVSASAAFQPADYSSEAADWSGEHPNLSQLVDLGPAIPGALASGTLSGSSTRLTGTSAAAPLEARRIARSLMADPDLVPPAPAPADYRSRMGNQVGNITALVSDRF